MNDKEKEKDINTLAKKRMDICKTCKYLTLENNLLVCSLCGCILEYKVNQLNNTCPAGYW